MVTSPPLPGQPSVLRAPVANWLQRTAWDSSSLRTTCLLAALGTVLGAIAASPLRAASPAPRQDPRPLSALVTSGRDWVLAEPTSAAELAARLSEELGGAADDALEFRRRVPWLATLPDGGARIAAQALGNRRGADRLWIESATCDVPRRARELLRAADERAAAGELALPIAATIAWSRGRVEGLDGAVDLFEAALLPTHERASYARDAFSRLVTAGWRRGDMEEIARLQVALTVRHPELTTLHLDAAAALLRAGDLASAHREFDQAEASAFGRVDTAAMLHYGSATLGRAWCLLLEAKPQQALALLTKADLLPRSALAQEDALDALKLRFAMVAHFIRADAGDLDPRPLAGALALAPVDQSRSIANDAWFGPFGPLFGRDLLRDRGRAEAWCSAAIPLLAALESSHDRHGHGLLGRSVDDDETSAARPVAWCFLSVSEEWLVGAGDPDAAAALLAPRLAALAAVADWSNRELACEAQLLLARIELHRGDAVAAMAAAEAALRGARELQVGLAADYWQRHAAGEAPPPPSAQLIGRSDLPYSNLVVRALVSRSGVKATLLGDARGAAEDLFEAGAGWPFDGDRWLRHATDFARRGRFEEARACAERADATPDRAYDFACCRALCGESEAALALLDQHLAWAGRTPATRALEVRYAAQDRDLASLHADPRFPRR